MERGKSDSSACICHQDPPSKKRITLLERWGKLKAMHQSKIVLGFDCDETFDFDEEEQVRSRSARGESWSNINSVSVPKKEARRRSTPTARHNNRAGLTI